jgi:hypothetical protein
MYMVYAVSLVETKQPPFASGILDLLIFTSIYLLFIEYNQYALIWRRTVKRSLFPLPSLEPSGLL